MISRLFIALMAMLFSASSFATTSMIHPEHPALTLAGFFGMGVLLSFTPCVLPMVPILSAILMGQEQMNTRKSLKLSLVFVLSMALTYSAAGVVAGYLGSTIQSAMQSPWIIISFSLVFVLMALSMFGLFNLNMPKAIQNSMQSVSNKLTRGSTLGVALMGVTSTLIASPCVTAPLVSTLTYISQTGNALQGGLILFSLALGMGLPLILFGMGQGALLPKVGAWMNQIKSLFGVILLGLAIWMVSRILPGVATLFLWAALLIVSAVAFGALNFKSDKRLNPVLHGLSVLTLLYGVTLFIGATSGHDDIFNPLARTVTAANASVINIPQPVANIFSTVTDFSELQKKLNSAKSKHKPVILEFYASWCSSCRELDRNVLSDTRIQQRMQSFESIRVDLTDRTENEMQITEYYHVYGTPTIILFDRDGKEVNTNRFNDGITVDSFDQALKRM